MPSYTEVSENAYKIAIGETTCTVIKDGSFGYPNPADLLFATAPAEERDAVLRERGIDPDNWSEATLPYLCLLIETDEETTLVDTGGGDLAPTTGNLVDVLSEIGHATDNIDNVVLSHAHPDHVGGIVADGEPVFDGADHYIPAAEYDYWLPEPDFSGVQLPEDFLGMMRATAEANLTPLADADRWLKITGEKTIQPGVTIVDAPGHTPGHVAVMVESEGESLVHLVDTVVHPLQISNPSWAAGFDHQQATVADTRQEMLKTAVESDVAMASHFPAPGLGNVTETEDEYDWDPVTS